MTATELCYLTMREASSRLQSGQLSPVDLTRAFLDRIEQLDDTLQAYITVLPEHAMAAARAAEADLLQGRAKGPLHGIPIALKDLYDTQGIRTTASSRVMADRVPTEDATTTARLQAAGAILLGKLSMHEFALGGPDPTCGFPLARNPWNLDHIPGGSSSGSGAAVAAGLCMGSLGSCTGGSIRGPAAYSSIVGLKATYGRVSRYGVVPLSWSLDHCGPMTWTVEDSALMLQAIAGYDPKDPTSSQAPVPDYTATLGKSIKGLTIGVPRHFFFADDPRIDRDVLTTVDQALQVLQELGAHIQEVTIPTLDYSGAAQPVIMLSEAFAYHEQAEPSAAAGSSKNRRSMC
jgi:aspartyl-tRNA(Asn)/glutamyl-tRNA(Gln) amidotransferase subunit A